MVLARNEKRGIDGNIYINRGTYVVPVWTAWTNIEDVSAITRTRETIDTTTRENASAGNDYMTNVALLKSVGVDASFTWDRSNLMQLIVEQAFNLNTVIDILVLSDDLTTPCDGVRSEVYVTDFSRAEPKGDIIRGTVKFAPATTDNAPVNYHIEECAASESTTSKGADVFMIVATGLATFVAGANIYLGESLADYTTAGTLIHYNADIVYVAA